MTGAEFLTESLIRCGVTDVFGIPGGVILDFLYELDRRKGEITAHLSFHEQCAGFAASGYTQYSGKIGVAYATKGPGITNLLTPVADAYSDGTPVLVVTAHSEKQLDRNIRFTAEQELDTVALFRSVTKYAVRIDSAEAFAGEVKKALQITAGGRKGPVLIDVLTSIFTAEIPETEPISGTETTQRVTSANYIIEKLKNAHRPIFLIGDGIHQSHTEKRICELAEKTQIPVLSSRCAEDVMPVSEMYYGYIGSHGIRYANFILSKADLIIAIGNRLAFPVNSDSYKPIYQNAEMIWIESDPAEAGRHMPHCTCFPENAADTLCELSKRTVSYKDPDTWTAICQKLKTALFEMDVNLPVSMAAEAFRAIQPDAVIVNDVGNNEFWSSRAYLYAGIANRMLYSKCFGALGCSLGKSIGAYYASRQPVLCVTGDQGLQLNSQELQFIGMHKLPITILLLNNGASGMIRSREKLRYPKFVHTTAESGYGTPDFRKLAETYGIGYQTFSPAAFENMDGPLLVEAQFDEAIDLEPNLPRGNRCQDMSPAMDKVLFEELDKL